MRPASRARSKTRWLAAASSRSTRPTPSPYIAHAPLEPRAAVAEWCQHGKAHRLDRHAAPVRRPRRTRHRVPRSRNRRARHRSRHRLRLRRQTHRRRCASKPLASRMLPASRSRVVWTREEEFTWAYFRPAGVIEIKSGVGADGTLTAWEFHNYNSGASAIEAPYVVPNQHDRISSTQYAVLRQGSYRGLAATANHFARESHMDDLAHAVAIGSARISPEESATRYQRASQCSSKPPQNLSAGHAQENARKAMVSASRSETKRAAMSPPAPK